MESSGNFPQKFFFSSSFGGHLEFLHKCKNAFISKTERDRMISTKFLTSRVSAESTGDHSPKNRFPATLVAILNFCLKCKNVFISETERHRAISTKFLTHRVSAGSTGIVSQKKKTFSRHFWRPS